MSKKMKQIMKYLDYWKPRLFLHGWEITVAIESEDRGGDVTCEINPNYEYRSAYLQVYPHFFSDHTIDQSEIILHELLHIILDPYKQLWDDMYNGKFVSAESEQRINETIVSWLTQIIADK